MTFTLSPDQESRAVLWAVDQDQSFAARQGRETPYYGASGGNLTYEFTPTSIGLAVRVRHSGTGEVLDLTDYDSW